MESPGKSHMVRIVVLSDVSALQLRDSALV